MANIEELGLYLKSIREERKIPLVKIAQELKAKPEFIQAIESNDFDKLPAPTYVKGFLRNYARHLGLDPDEITAIYNKHYPKGSEQVLVLKAKKIPHINFKITKFKLILWASAAAIVALAVTLGTVWLFRSLKGKPPGVGKDIYEKSVKEISGKPPSEKATPLSLKTPLTSPLLLAAQATDAVWIRVYADRKLIFEGILAKDEEKSWQAKTGFKLRIGNPGKLSLTLNNQELGKVAPYGPVNVVINKEGIKIEK